MIIPAILVLVYSIYLVLVSSDNLSLGKGMLRVALSLLGVIGLKFHQELPLTLGVLLYGILTLALLAITRNEVQFKDE